jgi:hypothetical protein
MNIFDYFKKDKNLFIEKIYYISFLLFFLIISLKVLIIDKELSAVILLMFPTLMLILLISNIFIFFSIKNKILNYLSNIFLQILKGIERELLNIKKSQKIPIKIAVYRLIYIFVFFIIPLTFMFIVLTGTYQDSPSSSVIGSSSASENGFRINDITTKGILKFNPTIADDYRVKLSYLMGEILEIPIFNLCFTNYGTTYFNDTNINSFKSYVLLEKSRINIPMNMMVCVPLNLEKKDINYEWKTKYEFLILNRTEINNTIDMISEPINKTSIKILEVNFLLMTLLVTLGWIAICHLIYNVIRDFNNIK